MRLNYTVKLLRSLNDNSYQQGMTLIELLMVIVIMGIIAAISLPSFLKQASRAHQAEAKQTVSALNRAQQAYFLENADFTSNINFLGMGVQSQSVNYSYAMTTDALGTSLAVNTFATSRKNPLKHYQGRVWVESLTESEVAATRAVLCETIEVKAQHLTNDRFMENGCGLGYRAVQD